MTREEFKEYYLSCDDKELVMETAKEIKADGVPITIEEIENRIRIKRSEAYRDFSEDIREAVQNETPPAPEVVPETVSETKPVPSAEIHEDQVREPEHNFPLVQSRKGPRKLPARKTLIILPLIVILAAASFFGIRTLTQYVKERGRSEQTESYDTQSQESGEWIGISEDISYKEPEGYKESGKSDKYIRLTNGEDTIIIQKSRHYDGSFDCYIGEYNAAPAKAGQYSGYEYTKDSEYFFMFENDNCDYTVSSNNETDCKKLIESISFTQGEQNND